LRLDDEPGGGARVRLIFAANRASVTRKPPADEEPAVPVGVGSGA
jgi:hypothetical protein